jgi:hypothetical protein
MPDNAAWKLPPSDQLERWAAALLSALETFAASADVPNRAALLLRLVGLRTDDMRRFVKHEGMEPWASMPLLTFCFVMHNLRMIRGELIARVSGGRA